MYLRNTCFHWKDPDIYKSIIRKQITDWLAIVSNKKNQEWMIVQISNSEKPNRYRQTFFIIHISFLSSVVGVFTTIHDRLKADFNVKKERFVRLKLNSHDTQACWNEYIDKIKDGILTSYTNQLIQYDEDSRRLDLVRLLPGWNYCQYFLLKVSTQ